MSYKLTMIEMFIYYMDHNYHSNFMACHCVSLFYYIIMSTKKSMHSVMLNMFSSDFSEKIIKLIRAMMSIDVWVYGV